MNVLPSSYEDVVSQRDELWWALKALVIASESHYLSISERNAARDLLSRIFISKDKLGEALSVDFVP